MRAWFAALVMLIIASGCQVPLTGSPPDTATGVVIGADGPSAAEVDRFSLRTNEGQVLEFTVGRLDLSNGGLPAPHLREHLVSGEPITVYYYTEAAGRVVNRYTDAQP